MISSKENALERKIAAFIPAESPCHALMLALLADRELHEMQEHANTVSIRRLGYNDHGPVHMRQVAYNAVRMLELPGSHAPHAKPAIGNDRPQRRPAAIPTSQKRSRSACAR